MRSCSTIACMVVAAMVFASAGGSARGGPSSKAGTRTDRVEVAKRDHTTTRGTAASAPAQSGVLCEVEELQKFGAVRQEFDKAGIVVRAEIRNRPASWFELEHGTLVLREPTTDETHHVMLTVQERTSGRALVPLSVRVGLRDAITAKELVSSVSLRIIWGQRFVYYGANLSLPPLDQPSKALLHVEIAPAESLARSPEASPDFLVAPLAETLQPLQILPSVPREQALSLSRPEGRSQLPGRHPPMTPTPYPGAGEPQHHGK